MRERKGERKSAAKNNHCTGALSNDMLLFVLAALVCSAGRLCLCQVHPFLFFAKLVLHKVHRMNTCEERERECNCRVERGDDAKSSIN